MIAIENTFSEPLDILLLLAISKETKLISKHQKTKELHLLKLVIRFALLALKAFINGDLVKFDAQVGENLCQIRAYKTLLLAKKWLISSEDKKRFTKILDEFKSYQLKLNKKIAEWEIAVKNSFHYDKNLDASENIQFFLERLGLRFYLHEDIMYLITCYLLRYFAIVEKGIITAINFNLVSEELTISKYLAKKIIKNYQRIVCAIGCKFVKNIAKEIDCINDSSHILDNLNKLSDDSRLVLPSLIVTNIILHHCIQEKIPILICINNNNNEIIYFSFIGDKNNRLKFLTPSYKLSFPFCLVLWGHSDALNSFQNKTFINNFLHLNPLRIILANTASHPQYSGKKLEQLRKNPYIELNPRDTRVESHIKELEVLKKFAERVGCSMNNQKTFFIKHIYASKISYEKKQLYSKFGLKIHDAYNCIQMEEICQEII